MRFQRQVSQLAVVLLLLLPWSIHSQNQPAKSADALRRQLQEKFDQLHAQGKFPGAFAVAVQVNTSVARATGKSLAAFIADFAAIIIRSR